MPSAFRVLVLTALVGSMAGGLQSAAAQMPSEERGLNEIFADSELENYLRYLQLDGAVPLYPWSIRAFSPREIDRLLPASRNHAWSARYPLVRDTATAGLRWGVVPPRARVIYNSAFPFGTADGPIWAGRGLTTALEAGVSARYGPLSAVIAPIVFRAENAGTDAEPIARPGLDYPRRFGHGPYSRIDPGQSTLRLDLPVVTAGVSTATQHWGPVGDLPLILGSNAPGFPHAFLGTSAPLDLWAFKLHARLVWGRLTASPWAATPADSSHRFMSGMVMSVTPRGVPGLEVGMSRFFNAPWPDDGIHRSDVLRPVEQFLKKGANVTSGHRIDRQDDQLVSVFARWIAPRSGFEVYGEYAREDYNYDHRDLVLEPDHTGGYSVGVRKRWDREDGFFGLRAEMLDARGSNLARVRWQGIFYTHTNRVGHTNRGRVLGSEAGYGGQGSLIALDRYSSRGRWTVSWSRILRQANEDFVNPQVVYDPRALDIQHALKVERLLFARRFDVTPALLGVYEMNRDHGGDAFNLGAQIQIRAAF